MSGSDMDKIKVIIKRPDEPFGHMATIENTLRNLQRIVGGKIEVLQCGTALMILNEEGKLLGFPRNFMMGAVFKEEIVGTVIICGSEGGDDGDEFASVPFGMETWKSLLHMWGN